ncbi:MULTISPECIES: class I SAM-dependent rRNA methyltransferase [unclassified Oceanobacter]|jgi:23S rRNA (cytosine1962-C5)-methyltransferase|uniref:class I SAM-dependent rRNA methyltransferase n=1 Tax=unclassified Oceanobacter TaxID=2620260 RepID=UPI0026E2CCE5|nr:MULTISPECIES: class I SAM-dependent rRNA methyltransferase [unclassified Oceanobacter]MDO6680788.1 class I SAM-dependent rRNA methyltransferase [Oceanobacter sp. 5_MG-2023]MDP2504557.1 class I SAM-dependent rRNA methyltransferase [Oceanobacter sp. 3_MG-2023]MDP2546990.1 class I SAM-dependent rRNA methyltransferase [Oceanobacter sp. 4_MG-2023]MDP2607814.1 class I SAM-dependent rRNA methyltransferase [Oceanobacter sp. 1_MG-2023]MDP2611002.1 class I SAM-dependent rRNA methyltransferase [Oceano
MSEAVSCLRLNPQAERRLKSGHLWVYSNEVDTKKTPIQGLESGSQVVIEMANGKALGSAVVSPDQLICARLISRDSKQFLDSSLIVHRLKVALSSRELWYPDGCYRWVYGDSDGLPGLVVDRFGDVAVVQISSVLMETLRQEIVDAIVKVIKPDAVVLKNTGKLRAVEGLPEYVDVVYGELEDNCAPMIENGTRFMVPVIDGQKTGWFYDHRENRAVLNRLVTGKRVLDVFSYIGGWGVQAARHGAAEVHCVDSSAKALDWVAQNAELNGVAERMTCWEGDAFEALRQLKDSGERFDVVVVDPPALIPRRKDIKAGEQAYHRLNQLAMRLLNRDGLLVAGSCSMHLGETRLPSIIRTLGRELDRDVLIQHVGSQGADHPVVPAIPETRYLKAVFARVLPTR